MKLPEALAKLASGSGRISRQADPMVSIYRWNGDNWNDFLKCRVTLFPEDLIANDWIYIRGDNLAE